jgi:YesN/AraC family two-component response regulator
MEQKEIKLRFMVVDNNPIDLMICKKHIEMCEVAEEIRTFTNPKTALTEIISAEYIPHILFLDIKMKEMNGFQFVKHLEKVPNEIINNIFIFFLSSTLDSRDIAQAFTLQKVIDIIPKPINAKKIISNLQKNVVDNVIITPEIIKKQKESRTQKALLLYNQVIDIINTGKHLSNPDLTLKDFAKELGSNELYVSKAVNEFSGMSFSKLINIYRIDEAKILLTDKIHENLSMEEIATQCGFSSLNTFYRQFKDQTGLTPKQYKQINGS